MILLLDYMIAILIEFVRYRTFVTIIKIVLVFFSFTKQVNVTFIKNLIGELIREKTPR